MQDPFVIEIRVEGHITVRLSEWFDGLAIHNEANGETTLTGTLNDQAALFGILNKIQALNLPLIALNRLPKENGLRERSPVPV